jgi:2-polyprenyl-3-methyl-5-hydroxy-6-metoxy-1,4-benzoquinol methylase
MQHSSREPKIYSQFTLKPLVQTFKVLDLFSGMGGFSYGFASNGFKTTGVDIKEEAGLSYKGLTKSDFILSDLHSELIDDKEYDIIIGACNRYQAGCSPIHCRAQDME